MQSMCSEKEEQEENQVVEIMKGGDVLAKCRVLDVSRCPPIPLCSMFPYPRVRGLRSDISLLKIALEGETYCPKKGIFIVSIVSPLGIAIPVTSDMRASWDAHWQAIDREFENELRTKKGLSFLSNKMLYVWEGNHCTVAWMELITEKYKDAKEWHLRVFSTVVDPTRLNEVSLLAGFLRMNDLNEHAVIVTNLKDTLVNAANIYHEIFIDDNSPPLDVGIHGSFHSGSSSRPKPLSQKEYVPPLSTQEGTSLDRSIFSFGCGDYISMGKDFASSIRNEDYAKIHTFFSEINKLGVEYKKKKKTMPWTADFVLLDLPMDSAHGRDGVPLWDKVSEDHIRHGLGVAVACLADSGWIVCFASISGDSPLWVEKYAPRCELEIVRRFIVEDLAFMGEVTIGDIAIEMDAFHFYMLRRRGVLEAGEEAHLRSGVQRSVGLVQCFLEALCPPRGLALEMGSGTAPLMRACIASGRPCYSFDSDPDIVARILQPLGEGPPAGTRDQSSSDEEILESEPVVDDAYGCPFD
ncbi:hypothetical protein L7F22_047639 [Adiantum nelumboides]|nr:hypothetical protein [Adiantum nelumboides]